MLKALNGVKKHFSKYWIFLFPVVITLFSIFLLATYSRTFPTFNAYIADALSFREAAAWGQLGDFMGGILNPFISLFTLIIAVMVWRLQKEELSLTRVELTKASGTADQQRREQRFFDLLNLYQRIVDSNRYNYGDSTFLGKSSIEIWLKNGSLHQLRTFEHQGFFPARAMFGQTYPGLSKEILINDWNCSEKANFLDHYFRMIYRILSEAETLLGADHIRYIKLLRAQLNRSELTVLAYNIWLDKEGIEMRPLAEKYKLLKHLADGNLKNEIIKEFPSQFF